MWMSFAFYLRKNRAMRVAWCLSKNRNIIYTRETNSNFLHLFIFILYVQTHMPMCADTHVLCAYPHILRVDPHVLCADPCVHMHKPICPMCRPTCPMCVPTYTMAVCWGQRTTGRCWLSLGFMHVLGLKSLGGKPLSLLSCSLPTLTHIKTMYTQRTVPESENRQVTDGLSRDTLRHPPCFQSRCAHPLSTPPPHIWGCHNQTRRKASRGSVGRKQHSLSSWGTGGVWGPITFVPRQEVKQGQEV